MHGAARFMGPWLGVAPAAAPGLQASARAYLPRHGRYIHRCLDAPHRCQNDLYMSTTGRRILTAKTMALAVMAIVFAVVAIWHRRRLDAGTAEHRSHSPLVRPSW